MAKLPTYQSTTEVQATPAPNLRGEQEMGQQISDLDRKANQVINDLLSFNASQKGKLEGQSLDYQEKTPLTRFDVIENRRAMQANQVYVTNDIRSQARKLFNQEIQPGKFNANSPENYQVKMEKYLQETLKDVPPANREYAKNLGDWITEKHVSILQNRASKYSNQQARAQLDEYLTGLQESAFKDAIDGKYLDVLDSMGQYGQGVQKINEAVRAGVITPEAGATSKENWKTQLQTQSYVGQFRNLLNQDGIEEAQSFMSDFIKNPTGDLSPKAYNNVINGMTGLLSVYGKAEKIQDGQLADQTVASLASIASGKTDPDSSEVASIYSNIANKQGLDAANEYNSKVYDASNTASLYESLKFLPVQNFNDAVSKLSEGIDPSTHQGRVQQDTLNKVVAAYSKARQEFAKDPKGFTDASPIVQQAASRQAINPNLKGYGVLNDGYLESANYNQTSAAVQKMLGASYNPTNGQPRIHMLSNEQAKNLVGEINQMPLQEQVGALQAIENKYPQYSEIALRDLKDAGLNISSLWTLQVANDSPQDLPMYATAISQNVKDLQTKVPNSIDQSAIKSQVALSFSRLYSSTARYQSVYGSDDTQGQQLAEKYALYLYGNGFASSPEEAATTATKTMLDNSYNFMGYNGDTIRVPAKYDAGVVKAAIKIKQREALKQGGFVNAPEGRTGKRMYLDSLRSNSHWVTSPDDTGVIMLDGLNTPVQIMDSDGNPKTIAINFESLANGTSEIAKKAQLESGEAFFKDTTGNAVKKLAEPYIAEPYMDVLKLFGVYQ